ncbi:glycosyl hydrolase 115 family protein [Fibrella forsythiae]|uniref:Glycosyl hydrolase 115 family protein n=1 Tax=Fibrella forsythiae TaxID=2817061 RepID=A0ABS3JPM7_9BACT|nr:glycosyl hydrolase 115 family protein [Fibrella forsythiae]MBO0951954.1 glycosyl hydrolase 115 family protein [Fibrella forsythiae]
MLLLTRLLLLAAGLAILTPAVAIDPDTYVSGQKGRGYFTLVASGKATPLVASSADFSGVTRALKNLQADIKKVANVEPNLLTEATSAGREIVLVGTLGKSPLIDQLVKAKKLNVADVAGKWETFVTQTVEKPFPGVDRALVIAGSDKRGTIFGVYDLSAQIGVSPWNWWADVPVRSQSALYVLPGRHTQGTPAVKYRGIFINDEAPALSGWTKAKFGGVNHKFYEHVFELILRMKGNYLWPAMWGNAFYDDDSLNPKLADEYGVVIGTTHHEPMMRAHDEWRRYNKGQVWNYQKNDAALRDFWRTGIQRMGKYESIVSVGMRGDGDAPMSRESNTALLEQIVADQRKILTEVTGKEASATPQLWALYKEVQDYYDKGMRVPDDVTLLLCDDNWGNLRKLPAIGAPKRAGGYGIYYHFDYVGGPRNYKWLNTNPISRTWEQMHLAYEHGVDRIWIVNVGDIKPMEFPIEFFLDYAWNPNKWPAAKLDEYTRLWAEKQFGSKHAAAIADILAKYTKYNARRKPELLSPTTYSLTNYREAETVVAEYNKLLADAEQIGKQLPAVYQDAYFQLVLHPVKACATLNDLYVAAGQNQWYAKQGRAITNDRADRVKQLFDKDAQITRFYNDTLAGGKWSHMMDQTHIGYTYWQQPEKNKMPDVKTIDVPATADMGVAIEGSEAWWPGAATSDESATGRSGQAVLPVFDPYNQPSFYIDVFNRGQAPFTYTAQADAPWLKISAPTGTVTKETRLLVSVDWKNVPAGRQRTQIAIRSADGKRVLVQAIANNLASPKPAEVKGFVESNGYVSIEAEHASRVVETASVKWQLIPDVGRTASGMTISPVTTPSVETPSGMSPRLEYVVNLADSGSVQVQTYLSPSLNFNDNKGLRYAISFDDEMPQVINIHANETDKRWEKSVADNIRILPSQHTLATAGAHTLKIWLVDPAVVVQKLVISRGVPKPSYLGPPESFHK